MRGVASACANIALVKYWGKKAGTLNIPARGSLSVTLDALRTSTTVELIDGEEDELLFDGVKKSGKELARVTKHLDLIRELAKNKSRARVTTASTFPVAAGLASSASGFAALAVAGTRAFQLSLDPRELSILARRGSGSAARSIFGGYVRMHAGVLDDGSDAYAEPIEGVSLKLCAAIAVARSKEKKVGSTEGMERTRLSSPYYEAWLTSVDRDLADAERALRDGDLAQLGEISEASCLAMHANAMAARPGIIYFGPSTLWAIERVRMLRERGTPVFFTIDAGPHLVAFTTSEHLEVVRSSLREHFDIAQVITSEMGGPAS